MGAAAGSGAVGEAVTVGGAVGAGVGAATGGGAVVGGVVGGASGGASGGLSGAAGDAGAGVVNPLSCRANSVGASSDAVIWGEIASTAARDALGESAVGFTMLMRRGCNGVIETLMPLYVLVERLTGPDRVLRIVTVIGVERFNASMPLIALV